MRPHDETLELLGLVVPGSDELAALAVGLGEGRRPADEGPVGVELHRADPEPIVAEGALEADRGVGLELVGQGHADRPDEEAAQAAGLAVGAELSGGDLRVAHRREPRGEVRPSRSLHRLDELVQRGLGVEVRAVRADVHRDGLHELARGVQA